MESIAVPLIGIAISIATFFFTVFTYANKAEADRVKKLEDRTRELEGRTRDAEIRLAECEEDRHDLRVKVYELMRNSNT